MVRIGDVWKELQRKNNPTGRKKFPRASLLGAADDRGVYNVGGRPGAARAPGAVRSMLAKFGLGINGELKKIIFEPGQDIFPIGDISDTHAEVQKKAEELLRDGVVPILIGGGHDYGLPHFAAAQNCYKSKTALLNVDAHLDVRPVRDGKITSGSPFYLALEKGILSPKRFVEFGIQEHCNDESLGVYLRKKKVKVVFRERANIITFKKCLSELSRGGVKIVVSFDVDAVAMAYAPGVSAPQADGFTPLEFFEMARIAGESNAVASVGFFEFAPPLDVEERTCRLVATAIHRFLSGLSRRRS